MHPAAIDFLLSHQHIAGLAGKRLEVAAGIAVRSDDAQYFATGHLRQGLLGAQDRQRAGQAAGIDFLLKGRRVRAAIKSGRTLAQAVATVRGDRGAWLLYGDFHKRNVSAAYAELEWE